MLLTSLEERQLSVTIGGVARALWWRFSEVLPGMPAGSPLPLSADLIHAVLQLSVPSEGPAETFLHSRGAQVRHLYSIK